MSGVQTCAIPISLIKSDFDVAQLLERVLLLLDPKLTAINIKIKIEAPPCGGGPVVFGDRQRLAQIFGHLLLNAARFSAHGGTIEVQVYSKVDEVIVSIGDQGIGMSAEEIAIALKPFRQVDTGMNRKFGGLGLGMSVAKAFVELHGGQLTIDSVPQNGTTVTVRLPKERLH